MQQALWDQPAASVRLADYDIVLVNSSAGKDSLWALLLVVDQARREGVLDRVVVVHADMGAMDWPGTRELAERQARRLGVRFEVVRRNQDDLLLHVLRRGRWPSSTARWCTSDHKRTPISTVITRLVAEVFERQPGRRDPVRVLNCLGMRAQESPARARKPPLEDDRAASNGRRAVTRWLPIHGATTEDVLVGIAAAGAELHPAYGLGQSRASCALCIFSSRAELISAAQANPELAQLYELVERRIGHRFRVALSMDELLAEAGISPLPDAWPLEAVFSSAPPAEATAVAVAILRRELPMPALAGQPQPDRELVEAAARTSGAAR
jgi:3'-phosphoadenosine 5'-phosphosulfate sulfotransferase (PAPS reductase)/FAD synthetase